MTMQDTLATERETITKKTVFVISPIGKSGSPEHRQAKLVLDYVIKKAFTEPEWEVVRADDENSPDSITSQVIDRIVKSTLIVADLSDHNPNVFYELAVAHGYKRPVIHMMKDGQAIPFDVVDQRVIYYDLTDPASVEDARKGLIASAEWLEENPDVRSPLTAYASFKTISTAGPGENGNAAIADLLTEMTSRLARLESTFSASSRHTPVWSEMELSTASPYSIPLTKREFLNQIAGLDEEIRVVTEHLHGLSGTDSSEVERFESRLRRLLTNRENLLRSKKLTAV
jgi:hypothetical protein